MIQCKINVLLIIHVTKKLYKDSLKIIYKYCTYKYSMINFCNMIVITITMNTMNKNPNIKNQKPTSSHNQQFIRHCINCILCYSNQFIHKGSPCSNKHFRSTKCKTIIIITYNINILNNPRYKQRISEYVFLLQKSVKFYVFILFQRKISQTMCHNFRLSQKKAKIAIIMIETFIFIVFDLLKPMQPLILP